jgi:phosphopantetheine adenylyltransferase
LGVDVESDTPGSIDARIILLDYVTTPSDLSSETNAVLDLLAAGPVIDLPTLALTRRRWNLIFSVDGEEGQALLAAYMSLANQQSPAVIGRMHTLSGGVSLIQKPLVRASSAAFSHNAVIVGGTFDHLHAGHKLLLTATALLLQPMKRSSLVNRRLIVGITGDELLKNKKYAEYLQSWKQRQENVVDFLLSVMLFTRSAPEVAIQTTSFDELGPNGRAIHTRLKDCFLTIECVEIQDPFGPTITDESVTALVVSAETRSGGQAVNERRIERGWKALEVFEIDVLDAREDEGSSGNAENFASKISSTAIRKRKAETNSVSSL